MSAVCRTCGAAIWWAHTTAGRAIPIDSDPVPGGNVVATGARTQQSTVSNAIVTRPEIKVEERGMFPDDRPRYNAHFVTCPNADEWRKR